MAKRCKGWCKNMIIFDRQVAPAAVKEKDKYLIHNAEELIKQLESLREDAKINMHNGLKEEIFYKDFNALTIAIDIIKKGANN